LSAGDFVMPLFVRKGARIRKPIGSMPGQFQLSVDELVKEAERTARLGVPAVILFGIPDKKDEKASGAYAPNGIVPMAVRALKKELPELVVIADVCLCEYMSHGHCGVVAGTRRAASKVVGRDAACPPSAGEPRVLAAQQRGPATAPPKYRIDNDATLPLLAKAAVAYAEAGADMVAPSDMMDGRVAAIRAALDRSGFADTPIMSYAAKYASAFYGPFREAAESPPQFGDRRSYQMDCANAEEALREVALDIEEGADIVMIKPALGYQDIIWRVKEKFRYPVACYNVSGEYAMVKAAAQNGSSRSGQGWLDERQVVLEMLTGFRRAGADFILTYWAQQAAKWLR
jgi:porphobilinogen synthase